MICDFAIDKQSGTMTCTVCGKTVVARNGKVYSRCAVALGAGSAGSHLKQLLSTLGVSVNAECKCNSRAMHMNAMGNDWCEQNIETIVEWLKEEASARGLPFFSTIARMLVRRAIANARKEASRGKKVTTA